MEHNLSRIHFKDGTQSLENTLQGWNTISREYTSRMEHNLSRIHFKDPITVSQDYSLNNLPVK
jgi:hypothetical protein